MALLFALAGMIAIALGAALIVAALTLFSAGGHWICLGYALVTQ